MKRLVALTLAALILQGCRVDKKDPRHVQAPPPPEVNDAGPTPKDRKSGYFGLNLNDLFAQSKSAKASARVTSVIAPMAAVILDQKNLSNPEFKGHSQTSWALNFMNTQIVEALKESPGDQRLKDIVAHYRNRILQDCHARELTACRNLEFFKRDPQLVSIIKVLAYQSADVEAYYRMLAIAFELKSSAPDPELRQMVYNRMTEFIKIYVSVQTSGDSTSLTLKRLNDQQRREFLFYSTFITSVLRTSPEVKLTGGQSVELYNWLASNQMETVLGRDLALIIAELVAGQLEQPEIWSRFVQNFNREQSSEEFSYSNALKRVQAADSGLLARLGVTPYDLQAQIQARSTDLAAVYFLSRLFDLRPAQRERYLWDIAKLEPVKAMDLIEAFVRVTLIDRALDTHKKMAGFYHKYQNDGAAKTELLYETMRFSDQNLSPKWKDYITRIQTLETFFADEIERRYSNEKGTEIAARILKLRNFFEELNPSIKYMVTYPNMIMLGYYASKLNLDFQVTTFFGSKIQITKELVLHDLMEGKTPPMFLYTSFRSAEADRNSDPIDSLQMLWALNFAMVMDLPKLYSVPAEDFLNTFISTYKTRTDNHMRRLITYHETLLRPNSEINQLLGICEAPEGATGVFENQIDIAAFKRTTFLGEFDGYAKPPLRSAIDAHNTSAKFLKNSFDEALEILRSDVDPKLRRLYLIRSAFKQARSTDLAAINKIDSMLSESLGMRARLLESSKILIEKLPYCMSRMRRIEGRRRRELWSMERDFVAQVQTALQTLAGTRDDASGFAALKSQALFSSLDSTKPLLTALNEFFIAKAGMDDAFNSIAEYRTDYAREGGFDRDSSGRYFFNYRGRDLMVRLAMFARHGFEGRKLTDRLDRLRITLPPTLKELELKSRSSFSVTESLPLYNASGDNVIRNAMAHFRVHIMWFSDINGATGIFRTFLREATALYKFESLGELNLEVQVACDAACRQRKTEQARLGAVKLIELTRDMLDQLNLNQQDLALLRMFDAPSFYNFDASNPWSNGPRQLFINENVNQDFLGVTDEVFTYLTSISLGYDPKFRGLRPTAEQTWIEKGNEDMRFFHEDAVIAADSLMRRSNYYDRAQHFYKSIRDKDSLLLFPIDPQIDKQIDLSHTLLIETDLFLSEIYIETAYAWVRSNPLPLTQFTTHISGLVPPILTNSLVGNYRAQIDKFHEDTSAVFKAAP